LKSPRILIIMSYTGGGHRSAALALREALLQLCPQAHVTTADIFSHLPFPLSRVGELYEPVVQYSQGLWQLMWDLTETPDKAERLIKVIAPLARPTLRKLLREERPDVVVSVYPLCIHALAQARQDLGLSIPQITVVTDLLNIHPTWLCPEVSYCVVPTERAREQALAQGFHPDTVKLLGLPVGLRFGARAEEKKALRPRLGLEPDLCTLLLMGGAGGIGPLSEVAHALNEANLPLQLLVVTGHNGKLRHDMEDVTWRKSVRLFGFVDHVCDLMAASDLLLTKAGPQTICEGLNAGLPILIFDALPGQEADNAEYVVSSGAGLFITSAQAVPAALRELLASERGQLKKMRAQAQKLARPRAALDIAQLVLEEAGSRNLDSFSVIPA
jgi:1,2-diacylglycerol 3-beta-galactosyltransferase